MKNKVFLNILKMQHLGDVIIDFVLFWHIFCFFARLHFWNSFIDSFFLLLVECFPNFPFLIE